MRVMAGSSQAPSRQPESRPLITSNPLHQHYRVKRTGLYSLGFVDVHPDSDVFLSAIGLEDQKALHPMYGMFVPY
jgi:hypothetical protein